MTKTYTLELEIVLDEEQQKRVVQLARRLYAANPGSTEDDNGVVREISAEEFIDGTSRALMTVAEQNPLWEELDVQVSELSCTDPDYQVSEDNALGVSDSDEPQKWPARAEEEEDEEALDEWEDGLYLCRWPNGEFSIVEAASRREAIIDLDEWAGADPSWLVPLETFMVDFRLDDSGQIELNSFGEETGDFIRTHCYPELDSVLTSPDLTSEDEEHSVAQKKMIREAVERERTRLWHFQPEGPDAKTEFGKDLQKSMGTTGVVADHYVEMAGTQILKSKAGEGKKPN
ncbi:MAG: hypothetical protein ACJ746_10190 [Bryobacteraceae bacterium]